MNGPISRFAKSLGGAIGAMRTTWAERESVDLHDLLLAGVAFRNFELYESLHALLERGQTSVAELLLRPLLESTVLLEWCMNDTRKPNSRALRFRRTCFEQTIELVESGYLKREPNYMENLRQSLKWFTDNQIKRIPPAAQMLEVSMLFRAGAGSFAWRYFSRLLHGQFENWHDYVPLDATMGTRGAEFRDTNRVKECSALAGYLVLNTMHFIGHFDPVVDPPDLGELDALWLDAYQELQGLAA